MTDPARDAKAARDAKRENSAGRLFVGCALAEQVRAHLQSRVSTEALPGKVVPPENWHLTFRFLGETVKDAHAKLIDELGRESLGASAEIAFGGYGAFPRIERATVLWLGVTQGVDALNDIASRVERAVRRAGFPAEQRPFNPHLTLSRLKPAQDVRTEVATPPAISLPMLVDRVVVFRSHQVPTGVRYEELESFRLS